MLALLGLAVTVYAMCLDVVRVGALTPSKSLEESFSDPRDLVLCERITFQWRGPRRWELVAVDGELGERFIQRVVGLPGERVSMGEAGIVQIDGVEQPAPSGVGPGTYLRYGNLQHREAIECGDGYYLLGDSKREFDDSRFMGPVTPQRFIGRPWLIVAPWGRMGLAIR